MAGLMADSRTQHRSGSLQSLCLSQNAPGENEKKQLFNEFLTMKCLPFHKLIVFLTMRCFPFHKLIVLNLIPGSLEANEEFAVQHLVRSGYERKVVLTKDKYSQIHSFEVHCYFHRQGNYATILQANPNYIEADIGNSFHKLPIS